VARRAVALRPVLSGEGLRVRVFGLQGGHSGIDIHKGRGNAVRILGRLLQTLMHRLPVMIGEIEGGSKRNVIPREASATLAIDGELSAHWPELQSLVRALSSEIRSDLGGFDPGPRMEIMSFTTPKEALSDADAALVAGLMASQHHGVLAMSPDVAGLVQTSTNLAIVTAKDGQVEIETSQRSPIRASKMAAARMVSTIFQLAGFSVAHSGDYPGWKPEPSSDIVRKSQAVHLEILGKTPELVAMHAGLECGVIGEKYPGMQTISFGPHIVDVHSPSERLKISSVEPFWRFLTGLLERV
jgi:dipeptidase D